MCHVIVELRQYSLQPGQRNVLIDLFERELIEPQEAAGMRILGQFHDLDHPDRFVWLRGFADMPSRRRSLAAFYGGPAWEAHRAAANATMIDSDNVLLLRPAWPGSDMPPSAGRIDLTIFYLRVAADTDLLANCREHVPALGWYATESSPNDFPRLPVREGELVLVRVARPGGEAAVPAGLSSRLVKAPETLRLQATDCSSARADRSSAHDFDFLVGRWSVRHRRLKQRLSGCAEWIECHGTTDAQLVLGGRGIIDDNVIELPGETCRALSVRSFDTAAKQWAIWWFDDRHPHQLDPQVVGAFTDGVGRFYGDDRLEGRPIRVRFLWSDVTSTSCRWQQAFSADGGRTWETNWVMEFARQSPGKTTCSR